VLDLEAKTPETRNREYWLGVPNPEYAERYLVASREREK
jgi:hypothetical protein